MNLLQTKLTDATLGDFVAATQGASVATWIVEIAAVALVVGGARAAFKAWRRWRAARGRVPDGTMLPPELRNLPPARADWNAPCPACGTVIDKDDADLMRTGLYVAERSPLGNAIAHGRSMGRGLPLVDVAPDDEPDDIERHYTGAWADCEHMTARGARGPCFPCYQARGGLLAETGRSLPDLTPPAPTSFGPRNPPDAA